MSDIRRDLFQPASKATGHTTAKNLAKEELAAHTTGTNLPHVQVGGQPLVTQGLVNPGLIQQQPLIQNPTILTQERVIGEAERIVGTNTLLQPGQTNLFGSAAIQSFEARDVGQVLDAGIMSDLQNKISQPFTQTQPTVKQGISGAFQTLPNVLPQNANVIAGQLDSNLNQGFLQPQQIETPEQIALNQGGQNIMGGQNLLSQGGLLGQQNLTGFGLGQNLNQQGFQQPLLGQQGGFQQQELLASQNVALQNNLTGYQEQFQQQLPVTNILQTGLAPNVMGSLPQSGQFLNAGQNFTGQNFVGEPALLQPTSSGQFPTTGLPAETAVRQKIYNSEQAIGQDLQNLQHKDQTIFNQNKNII